MSAIPPSAPVPALRSRPAAGGPAAPAIVARPPDGVRGSVLRAAVLALGLVAAGLAIRTLAPGLERSGLAVAGPAAQAGGHGLRAVAGFLGLGTLACAVGLPRQAVCFAAGFAFGLVPGTALALLATVLGGGAAFAWARLVGRDWTRRRLLGRFRRLAAVDALIVRHPFSSVLTLRLLPVGSALMVSLAAGLSGIGAGAFLAATALGSLPQTVVFVLLGSGVGVDGPTRVAIAVALFALSTALGTVLMRRAGPLLRSGPGAGEGR